MEKLKNHDFWEDTSIVALRTFFKTILAALICRFIFSAITFKIALGIAIIAIFVSIIWSIIFETPESCTMDYDSEDEDTDLADLEAD